MTQSSPLRESPRTTLRRKRERGTHERGAIDAILDEGLVCHVGFADGESLFVQPTAYARIGDDLYFHGAPANRMLRALAAGAPACVTVTLLDGLVLARSAFHHSMNYRSVMLLGTAERVDDDEGKRAAMSALLDHVAAGRSTDTRPPSAQELRATLVVRFPIDEGSAKVRQGGPIEEPEDLGLPVWAGQIPLEMVAGAAIPDDGLAPGVEPPAYVRGYPSRRRSAAGGNGDAPVSPTAGS
ncbi:MAG TPA: pyridoxamine 5'-phosphate oxidase family protein [Acidimicrobiales bacterium]|nr:pyridoxamine 5'-phosphate oxidase family protein [Acidimicrobiales bacterium]